MTEAPLLPRWVAGEVSAAERASWLLVPLLATAASLRLALPHRPDWLGHFLAGYGATLALLFALQAVFGAPRGLVLGTVVVPVLLSLAWARRRSGE